MKIVRGLALFCVGFVLSGCELGIRPVFIDTSTPRPTPFPYHANLKIFLEGPYVAGSMRTTLNSSGYLPTSQPFTGAPWNYSGGESVPADFFSAHPTIVDWILVDLHLLPAIVPRAARSAGFLLSNGSIVDYTDATSKISFSGISTSGSYYAVIRHRNHVAVMSNSTISVASSPTLYDFTIAQAQAVTTSGFPMMDLGGSGVFGLYGGELDFGGGESSNLIDAGDQSVCSSDHGLTGYRASDIDMDGVVQSSAGGLPDIDIVFNNGLAFVMEEF